MCMHMYITYVYVHTHARAYVLAYEGFIEPYRFFQALSSLLCRWFFLLAGFTVQGFGCFAFRVKVSIDRPRIPVLVGDLHGYDDL